MSVYKALGHAANQRGATSETRVLSVLQEDVPGWLWEVRAANSQEDAKGIDIVVHTDVGKLFLQVKSSRAGVSAHLAKRRATVIGVVRCSHRQSDEQLRARAQRVLGSLRKEILTKRSL